VLARSQTGEAHLHLAVRFQPASMIDWALLALTVPLHSAQKNLTALRVEPHHILHNTLRTLEVRIYTPRT
jgi:hypothetical protein